MNIGQGAWTHLRTWQRGALLAAGTLAALISTPILPARAAGPTCTVAATGGTYTTIQAAVNDSGCTTITVAAGTYTENVTIARNVTINGAATGSTIVDGNNAGSVFRINAGTVSLANLTIQHGSGTNGDMGTYGGAIYTSSNSTLTIDNTTLKNNTATYGGAFSGNARLTVTNSTVSGNTALQGGGIFTAGGGFTNIVNSTFSGNTDLLGNGTLSILNRTTIRNSTFNDTGAIFLFSNQASLTLINTIVANTELDCNGAALGDTSKNNLLTSSQCGISNGTNGNIVGRDPLLGPLATNGGPTQTFALLTGSPAINTGSAADCPATDQRGVARPQGARCDIGAYEYNGPAPTITLSPAMLPNGTVSTSYNQQLSASGSNGSYTFAVSAGSLPSGLILTSAGLLTGTPTAIGSFTFDVKATDGSGFTGSRQYTVTIGKASSTTTITADTPDPSNVGQDVTVQYTVTSSAGTPTGNVTVSDGTNSCTGTVAEGQCVITFSSAGTTNLTATYAGDTTFTGSTSAVALHTVVVPNGPPTALSLTPSSVAENQPAGTTVGSFATTDPDTGDTFTYALVSGSGDTDNASFTISGSTLKTAASFDYETKASYSIRVQVTDSANNTFIQTFTISVTNVNEAPVAQNEAYSTSEDTALSITAPGVLGNDTDVDGDALTAVLVTNPAHGTLTLNPNGSFTYTPAANYNGSDSFSYKASDGSLASNVATVTLTVTPVNDAPLAKNDAYSTSEDTALSITAPGVLGNDTDMDGNPLTASVVTNPAHGTLTLNLNGSFVYTPAANYNGPDSFTYQANDGTVDSNIAQVTLTVTPVNDAPAATNDVYSIDEDTVLTISAPGVLANDTDGDGDPLTAVRVTDPAHGTLTLNPNGSFTYTPAANYNGPDSFTYNAHDGTVDSPVATVSITVGAVNDPPLATNDAASTTEDTVLTISAPGVLANDTDGDGDPLTAVRVTDPAHGTLTLNANGSFSYTPAANYNGPDSFTYQANDGLDTSTVATVTITVNPVNDAPLAGNDAYSTPEDTALTISAPGVLADDSDVDGNALTASVVTNPAHGTLTLNPDGSFSYTPNANYNGPDSFTYRASDGTATSNVATVSLTITPVNDAPLAANDAYTTAEDTALTVPAPGVLSNDSDIDGNALTAVLVTNPAHGTLTLNANGSFTYTPAANYNGSDSFTYIANDGTVNANVATVTLTITAVNDAPTVAIAPGSCAAANTPTGSVTLLLSDVDSPAGSLTVSASSSNTALVPQSGISISGSGATRTLTIAAKPTSGTASITLTIGDGQTSSQQVITVKEGTSTSETITGTTGADILFAQGGDDTVNALDGNDLVCGGSGNDTLTGGAGNDALDGQNGDDRINGEAGNDTLTGGASADRFDGGADTDSITEYKASEGDTKVNVP